MTAHLRATVTCGERSNDSRACRSARAEVLAKDKTKIEGLWARKACIAASENPIVGNGQTAKDFALWSKGRWSDLISDDHETSLTSNFLPPSAPTCTGDAILQHFCKVHNDCVKLFALTQQVKKR
jgi:hypothetical protein